MRSLGILDYIDEEQHSRRQYVRDAVSLEALKSFGVMCAGFSRMRLESVLWSNDAEVTYLTELSDIMENNSRRIFTLLADGIQFIFEPALTGQISPGFTWEYVGVLFFYSPEKKRIWKTFAIPSPVFSMFRSASVKPAVGQALAPYFEVLLNLPLAFSHGYIRRTQDVNAER